MLQTVYFNKCKSRSDGGGSTDWISLVQDKDKSRHDSK
jgi:hypothetical protein